MTLNAFNSARWDMILQALRRAEIFDYIRAVTADYFRNKTPWYVTENGPMLHDVT